MTVGKAFALTAGFVGAVALGVAIGPSITDRMSDRSESVVETPAVVSQPPAAKPAARTARAKSVRSVPVDTPREAAPVSSVAASEPRLHARLKPVLNRGARLEIAAEGFTSAEQFATVAHAARNTGVPFMVLKHQVLNEGRSLTDAIEEYKPDADAKAEVARARSEAKSDLAEIAGN
jgi:hypothetical protein